jgi:hypothetical protein
VEAGVGERLQGASRTRLKMWGSQDDKHFLFRYHFFQKHRQFNKLLISIASVVSINDAVFALCEENSYPLLGAWL